MEVGDYVRTKYGITQYREYETTNSKKILCMPVKDGSVGIFANLEDVIKSSLNILDLIEVGDYVNGKEVTKKHYTYMGENFIDLDTNDSWEWGIGKMPTKYIKSIVTKEQFESMEYKIGEDK